MRAFLAWLLVGCVPTDAPDPPMTTDTHVIASAVPVTIEWGEARACLDPGQRDTRWFSPAPLLDNEPILEDKLPFLDGGGLAVGDVDGDHVLDLVLPARDDRTALYLGRGDGSFIPATDRLPATSTHVASATLVDLEGDGDLDLVLSAFEQPNQWLINDGTGTFTDITDTLDLGFPPDLPTMNTSFADVDQDGDLDAFVAVYGPIPEDNAFTTENAVPSLFFENVSETGPAFLDRTEAFVPADHPLQQGHTFQGAWIDADLDGDVDLYAVNDFGTEVPSQLFTNDAGALTWVSGMGLDLPHNNMGVSWGDLNQDGTLDLLVTAWDVLGLMVTEGGSWFNVSQAWGVVPDRTNGRHVGWGSLLEDVDNDGDLDAFVAYGQLVEAGTAGNTYDQPDGLYVQQQPQVFEQQAEQHGVAHPGANRGALLVDLNDDGWLDLLVRDLRGPTQIHLGQCGTAAWTKIELVGADANPFAIGATIHIEQGDTSMVRSLQAGGSSYLCSTPPEVHVGLGEVTRIERLTVVWPDGARSTFGDLPINRTLTIHRQVER